MKTISCSCYDPLCPVCLWLEFVWLLSVVSAGTGGGCGSVISNTGNTWGSVYQCPFKNPFGVQLLCALLLETPFGFWVDILTCFSAPYNTTFTHCSTHALISTTDFTTHAIVRLGFLLGYFSF